MKKYLLSFLLSLPLLASDYLTIDGQNQEMDRAFGRVIPFQELSQEELNQQVVEIGSRVYREINEKWTYCHQGSLIIAPQYWDFSIFQAPSGQYAPAFVFKGKTLETLSIALDEAAQKPAKAECLVAIKIAKAIILKEVLGKESFKLYIEQLLIHKNLTLSSPSFFHQLPFGTAPLEEKVYQLTTEKNPGHFVYIINISDYLTFIPNGPSQGENVVCVEADQYIGFGERFKSGPLTEQEIAINFYEELSTDAKFCEKYPTKDSYLKARAKHQEEIDKTAIYGYFNVKAIY